MACVALPVEDSLIRPSLIMGLGDSFKESTTTKRARKGIGRRSLSFGSFPERDDRGWTPLHVAARMGDLMRVQELLDAGADVSETTTGPKCFGSTAMHLAAIGCHLSVMEELLERGANIDARTFGGTGWTPLHNAAKVRNKKCMRFLIRNGAFLPPDVGDLRFNPPLHYCPGLEYAYEFNQLHRDRILTKRESEDFSSSSS